MAAHRTRLLSNDVTGLPLYAFAGTDGRVCLVIWRGGGTCGAIHSDADVIGVMNGGSARRGQALVGVVSDHVHAVDVTLRGRRVRVPVTNNAFVFPFRFRAVGRKPLPTVAPVIS